MKKVLTYLLIIAIGSAGVYYGLTYVNQKKEDKKEVKSLNTEVAKDNTNDETEIVPSRDGFVSEAIKLQTLAENKDGNQTCKCYNVKDLDRNTSLSGSILVHTLDDLYVSTMWLSNGYYILNESDSVATGLLEESSEQASLYCGEENASIQSRLCATNY